jgi:hypothetical protein
MLNAQTTSLGETPPKDRPCSQGSENFLAPAGEKKQTISSALPENIMDALKYLEASNMDAETSALMKAMNVKIVLKISGMGIVTYLADLTTNEKVGLLVDLEDIRSFVALVNENFKTGYRILSAERELEDVALVLFNRIIASGDQSIIPRTALNGPDGELSNAITQKILIADANRKSISSVALDDSRPELSGYKEIAIHHCDLLSAALKEAFVDPGRKSRDRYNVLSRGELLAKGIPYWVYKTFLSKAFSISTLWDVVLLYHPDHGPQMSLTSEEILNTRIQHESRFLFELSDMFIWLLKNPILRKEMEEELSLKPEVGNEAIEIIPLRATIESKLNIDSSQSSVEERKEAREDAFLNARNRTYSENISCFYNNLVNINLPDSASGKVMSLLRLDNTIPLRTSEEMRNFILKDIALNEGKEESRLFDIISGRTGRLTIRELFVQTFRLSKGSRLRAKLYEEITATRNRVGVGGDLSLSHKGWKKFRRPVASVTRTVLKRRIESTSLTLNLIVLEPSLLAINWPQNSSRLSKEQINNMFSYKISEKTLEIVDRAFNYLAPYSQFYLIFVEYISNLKSPFIQQFAAERMLQEIEAYNGTL